MLAHLFGRDFRALEEVAARLGEMDAVQQRKQRRFARAIRAEDGDRVATADGERDVAESGCGVVGKADVFECQHIFRAPI